MDQAVAFTHFLLPIPSKINTVQLLYNIAYLLMLMYRCIINQIENSLSSFLFPKYVILKNIIYLKEPRNSQLKSDYDPVFWHFHQIGGLRHPVTGIVSPLADCAQDSRAHGLIPILASAFDCKFYCKLIFSLYILCIFSKRKSASQSPWESWLIRTWFFLSPPQ